MDHVPLTFRTGSPTTLHCCHHNWYLAPQMMLLCHSGLVHPLNQRLLPLLLAPTIRHYYKVCDMHCKKM